MRFAFQIGFLTAALAVSLQAQHGGGSGGHAASHGGSSFHSSSGSFRPSTGFTGAPSTGFPSVSRTGGVYNRPSNSRYGRGYLPNRRAYAPFIYGAYFNPFYDSSFDYGSGPYSYAPEPQQQQYSDPSLQGAPYPPEGYYPAAPPPPYAPPQSYYQPAPPPSDPEPAPVSVTVILHSGQKIQVQNYAVMGDSFWDFSKQPARRIPLSSVDIAASTKATEANGGQFPAI